MKINKYYLDLDESYLFSTISRKIEEYRKLNKDAKIIRLGIGDVTLPLCTEVIRSLHSAVDDMADKDTFRGYGPEQGYDFLKRAINAYYGKNRVSLELDEIFVSDGAKSDLGNILDIFALDNKVILPNPVYPVYLDTNVMLGRKVTFIDANQENGFLPLPDAETRGDIVYLCSPNNPTGAVYSKDELKLWVDWALENEAVILFDAAYEAYIVDEELPRSIYEIEGAKKCAIEFCSLSKTAGFTGTRLGYTIVPHDLISEGVKLNRLWLRRQTTKFNGVPYIIQKGAEAVFTEEGQKEVKANIDYYRENAKIITDTLKEMGVWFTGGENSPYIWMKAFDNMGSWEFFDYLLENANVVGTPGIGFGACGEGFFRLTAFGNRENTVEAMERLKKLKK